MRETTYSEIAAFKSCRQRHHFGYVDLLEPRKSASALRFGRAIHAGLEAHHSGTDALSAFHTELDAQIKQMHADPDCELWDEDLQGFEEERALGLAMLTRYPALDAAEEPLTVHELEHEFSVRLPTPRGTKSRTILRGRVDGIVEDEHGNLFILEHKTAKQIDNRYLMRLDLDDQNSIYLWALRQLGIPVGGVIYNILAKWTPSPPKILSTGKLSTDKRQRTTYDLFMAAIAENAAWGNRPEMYADYLDYLTDKGDQSFHREKVYRNEAEMERIAHELYAVSRDMARPSLYRNPGACAQMPCMYRSICIENTPEGRMNYRAKGEKHIELGGTLGNVA